MKNKLLQSEVIGSGSCWLVGFVLTLAATVHGFDADAPQQFFAGIGSGFNSGDWELIPIILPWFAGLALLLAAGFILNRILLNHSHSKLPKVKFPAIVIQEEGLGRLYEMRRSYSRRSH